VNGLAAVPGGCRSDGRGAGTEAGDGTGDDGAGLVAGLDGKGALGDGAGADAVTADEAAATLGVW
jgi:hypothetical protein